MTLDKILSPLSGGFMEPQIVKDQWVEVDGSEGGSLIPAELTGGLTTPTALADYYVGEIYEAELVTGWAARLSAPGYMDATEWMGLYDTPEEAAAALVEAYAE